MKLITNDEHGEWLKRMHEAAGREWTDDDSWEGDGPSDLLTPGTAPRLIRFLVGVPEPRPLLDGAAAVPLVELLEDRLIVWWRIAPVPSASAVFGDEVRMLQRDVEGLDAKHQHNAFWIDHSYSARLHYVAQVKVADDLGTLYLPSRGGFTGTFHTGELSGHTRVSPSPPAGATELTISLGSTAFAFEL